jgi:hypothetical protein
MPEIIMVLLPLPLSFIPSLNVLYNPLLMTIDVKANSKADSKAKARPTAKARPRPRQDTPEIIMVSLPLSLSFVPSLNILYKPL